MQPMSTRHIPIGNGTIAMLEMSKHHRSYRCHSWSRRSLRSRLQGTLSTRQVFGFRKRLVSLMRSRILSTGGGIIRMLVVRSRPDNAFCRSNLSRRVSRRMFIRPTIGQRYTLRTLSKRHIPFSRHSTNMRRMSAGSNHTESGCFIRRRVLVASVSTGYISEWYFEHVHRMQEGLLSIGITANLMHTMSAESQHKISGSDESRRMHKSM